MSEAKWRGDSERGTKPDFAEGVSVIEGIAVPASTKSVRTLGSLAKGSWHAVGVTEGFFPAEIPLQWEDLYRSAGLSP